jgi:hypothetical protein
MTSFAALALLSLLVALSLVLLVRRLAGAFVDPLSGPALLATACGLVLLAAAVRVALGYARTHSVLARARFAAAGLAGVLSLLALARPGTPALAVAGAWLLVIASEAASWLVAYRPAGLNWPRRPQQRIAFTSTADESPADEEAMIPAGLVQQLTRVRENDRESIHALLLAEIPARDRVGAIHVAFCPPLEARPELTAHALDADQAEVRITQAETFGARIEVRVPAVSAEKRQVLVEAIGSATCRQFV